ncbi:MAG: carboxypeptidase-like regulatory domain-containing protein, partial [Prolixibacteraceae bacterium]|nr:carboxypeptidase-like regulatory domain-containing protein [Prolixibacteraceae bacterium]
MPAKKIFFLLITMASAWLVPAQTPELYFVNIRGKVTSAENGEPVPYAHVINPRVHGGTTTNADGYFSISLFTEDTLI